MRDLVRETTLSVKDLIAPLFVLEGKGVKEEISSMPGQFRLSLDLMIKEVEALKKLGVPCVSLFPVVDASLKNSEGSEALNKDGILCRAIKEIKNRVPEMLVMSDVALDPYSSDGHDGIVDSRTGEILNDQTLDVLAHMSVVQAQAGSDIVGPSDMMDGRVGAIRKALDLGGFTNVSIMSYTAKYASAFYGPFRDALDSAPKRGDKKSYQMDYANSKEAIREALLDEQEGADILMVKPGLSYLDVVARVKANTNLPVAVYNVSGEYAMVKAAAKNGWLNEDAVVLEMMMAFKRAGADMILTYFASHVAKMLK